MTDRARSLNLGLLHGFNHLTDRAEKACIALGVVSPLEIDTLTDDDILAIRGVGRLTLGELRDWAELYRQIWTGKITTYDGTQ
jgi:hypothetical protein